MTNPNNPQQSQKPGDKNAAPNYKDKPYDKSKNKPGYDADKDNRDNRGDRE